MTKLLDEAVEAVRRLPSDDQDDIARAIMQLAGSDVPAPVVLSPEERLAIARSRAAANRGEFATEKQVRAVWVTHGLSGCAIPFPPLPTLNRFGLRRGSLAAGSRTHPYPNSRCHRSTPAVSAGWRGDRGPYLIFYEATDAEIIIHALRHGARDPSDSVRSE
jgi:hypothetical protein